MMRPLCRGIQRQFIRCLAIAGLMVVLCAACSSSVTPPGDSRPNDAIKGFVQQTLTLELQGVRWKELMDAAVPSEYYRRFVWKPDVEPGWDLLTISESVRVDGVTRVNARNWDELKPSGDVEARVTSGYEVSVTFKNLYRFSRDGYHSFPDEYLRLFVVEMPNGYVITDRLHPPHFGIQAAEIILRAPPYAITAFNPLRALIQQKMKEKP